MHAQEDGLGWSDAVLSPELTQRLIEHLTLVRMPVVALVLSAAAFEAAVQSLKSQPRAQRVALVSVPAPGISMLDNMGSHLRGCVSLYKPEIPSIACPAVQFLRQGSPVHPSCLASGAHHCADSVAGGQAGRGRRRGSGAQAGRGGRGAGGAGGQAGRGGKGGRRGGGQCDPGARGRAKPSRV